MTQAVPSTGIWCGLGELRQNPADGGNLFHIGVATGTSGQMQDDPDVLLVRELMFQIGRCPGGHLFTRDIGHRL